MRQARTQRSTRDAGRRSPSAASSVRARSLRALTSARPLAVVGADGFEALDDMLCLLEEAAHVRGREHPFGALGADRLEDGGEALVALHHERHPQQILVAERLDTAAERRLV